jgi:hypothetical protein
MFKNDFGEATVWQVASSFGPRSMLNSAAACIGVSLIAEKFAGSEKLVVMPRLLLKVELLCYCAILWISR